MSTATTPTTTKKARTAAAKTVPPAPPADPKAAQRVADLLKMSSDATRVRVLLLLAVEPQNVTEICAVIGQSQPATSHHLALLRHSGIIESRRSGKNNVYGLTPKGRSLAETARKLMEADAGR
jgi:DNA-binding transcriptional ArsR family regulator